MPVSSIERVKLRTVRDAAKLMLEALGYNLKDQDIRDTPRRFAKMLYDELKPIEDTRKLFSSFKHKSDMLIILKDHETFTRCPHHLERVLLKISIGYISDERYIGVSKLARIADYFSRGLMLQEEIVSGISDGLMTALKPKGVAVIAEGVHLCMKARGVKSGGVIVTSKLAGIFLENSHTGLAAREEFFRLIS
ncbi:MAG: GTP cyclohydrolase 1 [Syntrophomonadaceae bacterium]|nr:GTP cyclohydrolase 1 [Bacillota bacterium]